MKKCPFCKEEIQDEAIKCRYCKQYLTDIKYIKADDNTQPESQHQTSIVEPNIPLTETNYNLGLLAENAISSNFNPQKNFSDNVSTISTENGIDLKEQDAIKKNEDKIKNVKLTSNLQRKETTKNKKKYFIGIIIILLIGSFVKTIVRENTVNIIDISDTTKIKQEKVAEISESDTLRNITIRLQPPQGYCKIDNNNIEAAYFNTFMQQIKAKNHILMVFADCSELNQYRLGKISIIKNYGYYLAPKTKGKLSNISLYAKSREEFINAISQEFQTTDVKNNEPKSLGILQKDVNAIYVGFILGSNKQDKKFMESKVLAISTIDNIVINMYLCQLADKPNISNLLSIQNSIVRMNIK